MEQINTNQFYQIEIQGQLDQRWTEWFEDFSINHTANGNTILAGVVKDQAALHGVLKKINNAGLTLISILPQERINQMAQSTTAQKKNNTLSISYQKKQAGLSLVIVATALMFYIANAWSMRPAALAGTPIPQGYGGLILSTLGFIIIAEIILQIVMVIGAGAAPKLTAAEQMGVLKANRNSKFIYMLGILNIVGLLFINFPAFCLANMAVITLLAAEIIKLASQLFYNRHAA